MTPRQPGPRVCPPPFASSAGVEEGGREERPAGAGLRSPDPSLPVVVDAREGRAGLAELLRQRGLDVQVQCLEAGDIALGARLLVERKTARDFLQSLRSGRLFAQASKLVERAPRPLLLLEGNPYDLVGAEQVPSLRGVLLSLASGYRIPLLQTEDVSESADCLVHLAQQEAKRARRRAKRAQQRRLTRPSSEEGAPPLKQELLRLLEALPDVGRVRARSLAERFGTMARLASAGLRDVMQVPGVGPHTAARILEAVQR